MCIAFFPVCSRSKKNCLKVEIDNFLTDKRAKSFENKKSDIKHCKISKLGKNDDAMKHLSYSKWVYCKALP